jgi:cellulase
MNVDNLPSGGYTDSTPGIKYNVYNGPSGALGDPSGYVAPGPSVWSGAAGGSIGKVG